MLACVAILSIPFPALCSIPLPRQFTTGYGPRLLLNTHSIFVTHSVLTQYRYFWGQHLHHHLRYPYPSLFILSYIHIQVFSMASNANTGHSGSYHIDPLQGADNYHI